MNINPSYEVQNALEYAVAPEELTQLSCEQMQAVIDEIGEDAVGELTFDEFRELVARQQFN